MLRGESTVYRDRARVGLPRRREAPGREGVARPTFLPRSRRRRSSSPPPRHLAAGRVRVRVESLGAEGWAAARKTLDVAVVSPQLGPGATGASVRLLEQRLAALHYALLGVDASFGADTVDALYAFEKLQGLPRTGSAGAAVWAALSSPRDPALRGGAALCEHAVR